MSLRGPQVPIRVWLCPVLLLPILLVLWLPTPRVLATPGLDVHFDPWTQTLSWTCGPNVTGHLCTMTHKALGPIRKAPRPPCRCMFSLQPLHQGVDLTVNVSVDGVSRLESVSFPNPGAAGTAAANLSCTLYDGRSLNCSWVRGPAAPGDVQYFLHLWDRRGKRHRECPMYIGAGGTHLGCHLAQLGDASSPVYILVNGSSRLVGIRFYDDVLSLKSIELFSPPSNISVTCNNTHCNVGWDSPRTYSRQSNRDLQYQLDIRTEIKTQPQSIPVQVEGGQAWGYVFPSHQPRGQGSVRMRTADSRSLSWGPWSQPMTFGGEDEGPDFPFMLLLLVLGTLVLGGVAICLCKRFLESSWLCPQVPRVRDKLTDGPGTEQIAWDSNPDLQVQGDTEDLVSLQDMIPDPTSPP